MKKHWKDRIIAILLIGVSIYLGWEALNFPLGGGLFPLFSFSCIILLSLIIIFSTFFVKSPAQEEREGGFNWGDLKPYLLFFLLIFQVFIMQIVGYFVSTGLFLIAACFFLGIRRFRPMLYMLLVLFPALYLFFVVGLKVNLPKGVLY